MRNLPPRKRDSNKGDFGHVLIIGGDFGMAGAVIMAAEAACRAGAGRITVLTHQENFAPLLARAPNVMTAVMTVNNKENSQKIFDGKTVIAIGCGLGKSKWGRGLFEMAMAENLPKIIDADALNILAEGKKNYDLSNSIITPHPSEAARLLGLSTGVVQQNRKLAAEKLREKFGAVVVLKGEGTLILGENFYRCNRGNPGMACAGMGDVLTGIIAGLVAQNLSLEDAAINGVNVHATAGDVVAKEQGEIGMMPSDLFLKIPRVINGI